MIKFPIDPKSFIVSQENMSGCKVDEIDCKFLTEIAGLLNSYYEKGKPGREVNSYLDGIEEFYASAGHSDNLKDPNVQKLHQKIDEWCMRAYQAGKQAAQHG